MAEEFSGHNSSGLPDEDKMGFAVPKTPTRSLMPLNSYMRTDVLQHMHSCLHKMRDKEGAGLHYIRRQRPLNRLSTLGTTLICSRALPAINITSIQITNFSPSRIISTI